MFVLSKKQIGEIGEKLAIRYLVQKNYLILDTNYYSKTGEIDVIVRDKNSDELVFVEVKTRTSHQYGWPEESVNDIKLERLIKTAEKYLSDKNYPFNQNYRFDCLSVELSFKTRMAKMSHFKYI